MADSLENRVVIVLGASRGFGAAASEELLLRGATVVMGMHHDSAETAANHPGPGRQVLAAIDVRRREDVLGLARRTRAEFGRIDGWVNSASVGAVGHFDAISLDSHVDVIQTDLIGTLYASYSAIEEFRTQPSGGVLINVAVDPDSLDLPYMVSYAAAKHGVIGLTSALRAEVKSQGWKDIHICSVLPGDQAKLEPKEVPASGEMHAPPLAQLAVLDEVGVAIADLLTHPRDVVKVHGARYFL